MKSTAIITFQNTICKTIRIAKINRSCHILSNNVCNDLCFKLSIKFSFVIPFPIVMLVRMKEFFCQHDVRDVAQFLLIENNTASTVIIHHEMSINITCLLYNRRHPVETYKVCFFRVL